MKRGKHAPPHGIGYLPLPPCAAGEAVHRLTCPHRVPARPLPACLAGEAVPRWFILASELLHLPGKLAGVDDSMSTPRLLAAELLHLPHKAAGAPADSIFPAALTRYCQEPLQHIGGDS